METIDQLRPSASKSRVKNVVFWVLATVMLCTNLVVLTGLIFSPSSGGQEPEALEKEFNNSEYGIRLRLPASWAYTDAAPGYNVFVMQFASSQAMLNEMPDSPQAGMGILVYSGSQTANELFPDATGITEINELAAADQFPTFGLLEEPFALESDLYPASSGVYLFAMKERNVFLNSNGRKTVAYLTVVQRGNELIRITAVCAPNRWLASRPTLEAILQSLEISPRQY